MNVTFYLFDSNFFFSPSIMFLTLFKKKKKKKKNSSGPTLSSDPSSYCPCCPLWPWRFTVRPVNQHSPAHHAQRAADRYIALSFFHTHVWLPIHNLCKVTENPHSKHCVFAYYFDLMCYLRCPPLQVCPQSLCSPPPPARPSAPSPHSTLPLLASTPPPRYQVGDFSNTHVTGLLLTPNINLYINGCNASYTLYQPRVCMCVFVCTHSQKWRFEMKRTAW